MSSDPDDNPPFAMALAGEVDYLVSGYKPGALALKKIGNVRIVFARRFLNVLERQNR